MYNCNRTRNIRRHFNITQKEKELIDNARKEYKLTYVDLLMIAIEYLKAGGNL